MGNESSSNERTTIARSRSRSHFRTTREGADELGMRIQAEPAMSKMLDHPASEEPALCETRELIRRDRNRPSIAIWNMINEEAAA